MFHPTEDSEHLASHSTWPPSSHFWFARSVLSGFLKFHLVRPVTWFVYFRKQPEKYTIFHSFYIYIYNTNRELQDWLFVALCFLVPHKDNCVLQRMRVVIVANMNWELAVYWTLGFKHVICSTLLNPYSNLLKIKKTLVTEVPSVLKADLHYSKCKEIYISTFNILANYCTGIGRAGQTLNP